MMRKARLNLNFEGKDISKEISPYLKNMTYSDFSSGKADDLQITLEDTGGLWSGDWFPEKGSRVKAEIECSAWGDLGDLSLSCGSFQVDDITSSGPPAIVTMKAISSMTSTAIKNELKERVWEAITLEQLAGGIAAEHGLSLFFSADQDAPYERVTQSKESDLALLARLCKARGLNLKMAEEKLVLYEGKTFEAKAPVFTLKKGASEILTWSFNTKSHNIYRACTVQFFDPTKKRLVEHTFTPENSPKTGQGLVVNSRVESIAEAQTQAVAELRSANKEEVKASFSLVGNPRALAGLNVKVEGFGIFDGIYFIDEAKHSLGAGYKTNASLRKVLGY